MALFVAHMEKIKGGAIGLKSHNERDTKHHSNENINVSKKFENVELVSSRDSSKSYEFEFKKLIKKKYKSKSKNGKLKAIRKDAVKFNSFVFSASPEFFENKSKEQQIKYFEDCKKYLETKFDSENIISAKIHFDETSPHMHLISVPLTPDGDLSSKKMFDRQFFRELQEECPKYLEKNGHEVKRGENSEGINKRISDLDYKKNLEQEKQKNLEILKKGNIGKINVFEFHEQIKKQKSKIQIYNETSYKIYENQLDYLISNALLAQEKQKENEYLKKDNDSLKTKNISKNNSIWNLEMRNDSLENQLKKAKKLENWIKEQVSEKDFNKIKEKVLGEKPRIVNKQQNKNKGWER